METSVKTGNGMSEADIRREVDEINAMLAMNCDEEEASWIAENSLNNTNNQPSFNVSNGNLLDADFDGFDISTGDSWIFPIGFEKRDYQLNISRNTLFNNTLVILPTGLGKTLIASVTIFNFYRWYPKSKIIFMAPTRPLVNQQIAACYSVVGISPEETAEMTGKITNKDKRKELWHTKRVFFATAQVVVKDIADGILPTDLIKLLCFDEAHKARGDFAYCQVIKEVLKVQRNFRVLALTATAGKSSDVIQIIQNLLISKIEYRSEDSIDVRPYTHKKSIETVCVKLTPELEEIRENFLNIIEPLIRDLRNFNYAKSYNISKGYLVMELKRVRESYSHSEEERKMLSTAISSAISFYHSLEILERHSVHLFLKSLKDENDERFKFFINKDRNLLAYCKQLDAKFAELSPYQLNINTMSNDEIVSKKVDFGHPKFDILKTKLEEYFNNGGSKAIIFCEYRDTTVLIATMLHKLKPLVIHRCLVGQGGNISQKDQLRIMKEFREGAVNTLVCTCVGEEGLDIGSVDLVICFDIGSKNATRFVQRIGRTARKRSGKVIVLATQGRELQMIKELVANKDSINKSISRNKDIAKHFYKAPRLVPRQFNPQCIETKFVIAQEEEEEEEQENEKGGKGKKTKKKKESKKDKKLNAVNTKGSITNHFKPTSKKISENKIPANDDDADKKSLHGRNEIDVITIDLENDDVPMEVKKKITVEEATELYKNEIQQFIQDNKLESNTFLMDLIEYRARDGVESIRHLAMTLAKSPIKRDENDSFDEIACNINFKQVSPEKKSSKCLRGNVDIHYEKFSRYGNQFNGIATSSPFVPLKLKVNESAELPQQSKNNFVFATPDSTQFKKNQRKMSASTPLCGRNLTSEMNEIFFSQAMEKENAESVNEAPSKAFPFLGLNSVSDIFADCESNVYNDITAHKDETGLPVPSKNECAHLEEKDASESNELNILERELLGCSITANKSPPPSDFDQCAQHSLDLINSMLSNDFGNRSTTPEKAVEDENCIITDLDDLFLESMEQSKNIDKHIEEETSCASDKTEIYDIEEEIAKVEASKISEKENTQEPSICNFISVLKSIGSTSKSALTVQNSNVLDSQVNRSSAQEKMLIQNSCESPIKPVRPRLRCSPETPKEEKIHDTESSGGEEVPKYRNKKKKKKKRVRNEFVFTQVDVSDDEESSDENEDHDLTTLGGFVVHESICEPLNQTDVHLKYLESLRSPNAPTNKIPFIRPLKPMNLSEIYSQAIHEVEECEEEEDDGEFASFIVDDEVHESESEVDELELAERKLRECRRKRRMNVSGEPQKNKEKRRKIVRLEDSSSEDEEMKKLRKEVGV